MPTVDLVMTTIGVVVKIKGVLEKFRRNNDECGMIYGLVDTVGRDLMLLRDAPIMEDATVRPVMERLKCTLERTAAEAIKCQTSCALVRFFRTDDVAAKLDQLRQDISEKMLGLVLATSVSTNTLVQGIGRRMDQNFELMHQEMHKIIYAALAALLQPLQSKLELSEQRTADHTTEDARNKNRRETEKTGLIKYSWSALEASLASNEEIGGGHISTVYKGELNKISVAIKKFGNVNLPARERFVDELRLVSKLQHGNVIEILGHCYEYSESLVQEGNDIRVDGNGHLGFVSRYMPNQSLVRIIKLGNQPIDWPSLFRLIQGIAKGVHYLHEQRVVHLDLKPKTILLDHDMTPKINDFGTARELGPSGDNITLDVENIPGTKGYMAPELSLAGPTASTKSDVYSFGVILLETISLMCATSEKGRPRDAKEWLDRTQGTELRDLFDTRLVDGELQQMVATRCVLVGLMCCLPDPAGRPSMQQVVDMLAGSCAEQNGSTNIASSSNTGTRARDMEGIRYNVLTQDDLRVRLEVDTHKVGELLSITPGLAAVLLRHCQWRPERVQGAWFDNGEAFRVDVGLPSSEDDVSGPRVLTGRTPNCQCFDGSAGRPSRSSGCSHYFCDECWRRYIRVAMDDEGPRCLPLRCPHQYCAVPVVRELVVDVVHDADADTMLAQYDRFMLLSYVDDSGGRIQWCHGRGCSRAVEFLGSSDGDDSASTDVFCECRHGFCWTCGKEPHRPVSCDAARAWVDENRPPQASLDDQLLEKALRDMDDLKSSWLENMATDLGIEVTDLDFVTQAYEEIAECRRRIRWVHAYGSYYLDPERDRNKCELFGCLLKEAKDSLDSLQLCADKERLTLCTTEVVAIAETYSASKKTVMDHTRETRQHFDNLVKAAETHFQD
ncbi:uncharacterized protein [Miscanthus floridulus]|uniref:uncharacterized protein isoform X2 n=1 Tax=Miscanthus floridulus TaxID=154761 RepID=UPI003459DA38